jgi:hypothetical protein
VLRAWVALCLITWLRAPVMAGPSDPELPPRDRDVVVADNGSDAKSPWIDLSPSNVLHPIADQETAGNKDHRVAAALTVGGLYAGFTTWTYFAWYRKHKPLSGFKLGGDGWLGDQTYAGGSDKFGHAWATMSLARLGTRILDWGGFEHGTSNLVGTALSEALFLGVEVKDGFFFEFSFSDAAGDTVGALMAYALERWPRLDELFDFRVEYFPSTMYLRKLDGSSPCAVGTCSTWNIAEDYSGETYLLALHLGAIHQIRDRKYGLWSQFVDVTLGFDTRNYKPTPDPEMRVIPRQDLFIGVSLNAQGLFDWLLDKRAPTARKITHALGEVFNLPYTSTYLLEHQHQPSGAPRMDGAL